MEEIAVTANIVSDAVDFSMFSLFLRADLVVKSVNSMVKDGTRVEIPEAPEQKE